MNRREILKNLAIGEAGVGVLVRGHTAKGRPGPFKYVYSGH